ncbi:hypothetical protein BACCAP_01033 [Pseudoflavonifractor capillosus ATCC 29799]|uniref:Uncharacterized protein n=1 Tax=Pseudoflavonifractor capillosus ATCC 29799 TaxID=411467 RepID=A6NS55_9FIRM|nr:hypothetical protein BACCAP_01033 [Pseudoflavonifractor capillosus ATCC 29799]
MSFSVDKNFPPRGHSPSCIGIFPREIPVIFYLNICFYSFSSIFVFLYQIR